MLTFAKNFYLNGAGLTRLDWLAPLFVRLYLAPVFLQAGWNKIVGFDDTVAWFEYSLNLPMPTVMATLAAGTEFFGGILLILGLAIPFIVLPLMITMLVAAFLVHWENGWLALSDASSWLANDRVLAAADKKERVIAILHEHGNYDWLTSSGSVTILNNGIEFAITYFIMLLALLFLGAGKFVSADYWIKQAIVKRP